MKARHKRLILVATGLALLGGGVGLVLSAFQQNLVFFFSPTEVATGAVSTTKSFRIGGLVKDGSVQRAADGITVHFVVTDTAHEVPVAYRGPLPDLFREGKGVVTQGKLDDDGTFVASEVLAKHDENYMPPEAAEAIERAHQNAARPAAATSPQPPES